MRRTNANAISLKKSQTKKQNRLQIWTDHHGIAGAGWYKHFHPGKWTSETYVPGVLGPADDLIYDELIDPKDEQKILMFYRKLNNDQISYVCVSAELDLVRGHIKYLNERD
jgi:hypothetical protein